MPKVGGNEPCPCGSGRKYKKCCAAPSSPPVGGLVEASSAAGAEAYLTLSEVTGKRLPPEQILAAFRGFGRQAAFVRLAERAATLANSNGLGPELSRFTEWALNVLGRATDSSMRHVAQALRERIRPGQSILHEKVLYLLQSLALSEGAEQGRMPSDAELAWWALALNDYAGDWAREAEQLTDEERLVADLSHALRFNRNPDPVRELVRAELLMNEGPPRHPGLSTPEEWLRFQTEAFGCPFAEYLERFLGPLALHSTLWRRAPEDGPVLNPQRWGSEMSDGGAGAEAFLRSLAIDVGTLRSELLALPAVGGVIRFPRQFYRSPFVAFEDGSLVAASPWLVQHQLAYGFWGRCLAAVKARGAGWKLETWLGAFGELFELYCRRLSVEAQGEPGFPRGQFRFLESRLGSPDEIEDVVLVGERDVVLFSCKARMMLEKDVRGADSPKALVSWLDEFFFVEPQGAQRAGAFRLLDKKVQAIRAGEHEPILSRSLRIFPVVLTYDRVGESLYVSRWLRRRLSQAGILQQPGVEGPLVLDVSSFEIFLSVVANGEDPVALLEACLAPGQDARTFHHVVRTAVDEASKERLPLFRRAQEALVERIKRHFRA